MPRKKPPLKAKYKAPSPPHEAKPRLEQIPHKGMVLLHFENTRWMEHFTRWWYMVGEFEFTGDVDDYNEEEGV